MAYCKIMKAKGYQFQVVLSSPPTLLIIIIYPTWRMQNARIELLPDCFMSERENLTKELPTSLNLILTVLFRIACYC